MMMMNKLKVIKVTAMKPLWDGIIRRMKIYGDVIQLKKKVRFTRKWFLIIKIKEYFGEHIGRTFEDSLKR